VSVLERSLRAVAPRARCRAAGCSTSAAAKSLTRRGSGRLPVVGAGVVSIAVAARVLDRWLPHPEETLGFLVLARGR
jgi:hypothetical protein